MQAEVIPVAPPIPAPYLAGVPQLPDGLLAMMHGAKQIRPCDDLEAQVQIREICTTIRRRRAAYETIHGVKIVPEPRVMG